MYIAMNRFRIAKGSEPDFEELWRARESYLDEVPGFREFHLLRGPTDEQATLYASHSVWESRAAFEAWTESESFRKAHAQARAPRGTYLEHPRFEGFDVVLWAGGATARDAMGESATRAFDPFTRTGGEPDYASMAELRRGPGIARLPSGFWYLARYEDCRRAFTDPRSFANEGGMRAPGVVVPREERMINEMDPPDHTRLRKLELATLNQTGFHALEPAIRKQSEELLDALPRGRPVDLVPALTAPVPSVVTALLVGIPPEDHPRFRAWSEEVCTGEWVTHNRTARGEGLHGGHPEFAAYIDAAVAARRRAAHPPDDLLTQMVRAESDGERMSDTEIRIALAHLIVAGNETTANLLANLLLRMLERPELYAELAARRERIPAAIEESLRVDAPVQLINRSCREAAVVRGVRIERGDRVMLGIASANRDEAAFGPDADRFRTDRQSPPPQLSFGFGPHLCLGANLARLEARVVVNAFLDRFPRAGLAPGFRAETIPAFWELGLVRLDALIPA